MNATITLDEEKFDVAEFYDATDDVIGIETSPVAVHETPPPSDGGELRTDHKDWRPEVVKQLSAIQNLSEGWDSRGAARPDVNVVKSALALLEKLYGAADIPKPHINPTPSGGVQLDWESEGRYFEIELIDPRIAEYYYQDRDARVESVGTIYYGEPLLELLEFVRRVHPQS